MISKGRELRILFVGETWMGSSARSLREALAELPGVYIDEIGEDHYLPKHRMLLLRLVNRLVRPFQRQDLRKEILARMRALKPDVLIVYKGNGVGIDIVDSAKAAGAYTVNVFPDYSPHAYGRLLREAMGGYDRVVSTKPFHPAGWKTIYGYRNECVCVPHGYDPEVHYWSEPPVVQDFDVVLAASWRPQYETLMREFRLALGDAELRVALVGPGWGACRGNFPSSWEITGPLYGRAYGEAVRRGKVVIAPVHSEVFIKGVQQPGDEDTTRTYELAASGCFFLHRRTPFAQKVYDEQTEVPMWDNAGELAALVLQYLPQESLRRSMALKAHQRAVPAYSIPARAAQVLEEIRRGMAKEGC